jgi:hypothetical protein
LAKTTIDSFNGSTGDVGVDYGGQQLGQSFTGNGTKLTSLSAIFTGSNPTGNSYIEIYAHSGVFGTSSVPTGAVLATSDQLSESVNINGGTNHWVEFSFSGGNQITLINGTHYVWVLRTTVNESSKKWLHVFTGGGHAGNDSYNSGGGWDYESYDYAFYAYSDSYVYQGVLYIYNGSEWVPKPSYTYQNPYTARPTYAYYNGQWNLIQSF